MTVPTFPLQFGIPGGPELLIILLIAVLLFGANKIPKLARSTGEAMGEFQKGREEVEQELQEMREGVDMSGSMDTDRDTTTSQAEPAEGTEPSGSDTDDQSDTDDRFEIEDAETDEQTN